MEKMLVTSIFSIFPQCFLPHQRQIETFSSLSNDKFLGWTKLKAFADDKLKVVEMIFFFSDSVEFFFSDSVENTVGKGENAGNTVFSKYFFFRIVKSRDCVVKNKAK